MQQKIDSGEIFFTLDNRGIKRRTYLADHQGLPASALWYQLELTGHNRQAKGELKALFPDLSTVELFATPKPEKLMKYILEIASEEGDIVLDCFAGSGTTPAVAHKMKRHWVAMEVRGENINEFILPRMRSVVSGTDEGGVTIDEVLIPVGDLPEGVSSSEVKAAIKALEKLWAHGTFDGTLDETTFKALLREMRRASKTRREKRKLWDGGDGFTFARVAPSMFEDFGGGVVLADWATNGALALAVAAQLGYGGEIDGPFVGTKGRSRLAVIDGMLTTGVADFLLGQLDRDQTLMAVAQTLEPGVADHIRRRRPGSRARKVPRDLAKAGSKEGERIVIPQVRVDGVREEES
jgi:adenine-specific DNA-methyltransferase